MSLALDFVKTLILQVVVAGVLIGYRKPILHLLARLTKVDAVDVSATFETAARSAS